MSDLKYQARALADGIRATARQIIDEINKADKADDALAISVPYIEDRISELTYFVRKIEALKVAAQLGRILTVEDEEGLV